MTDTVEELIEETRKEERDFWIAKFQNWVECARTSPDLNSHQYIKSCGFEDCINAMKENDRWMPAKSK